MRASTASREAVPLGQHHVEDHRVVVGGPGLKHGGIAVARHVHGVALLAQPLGQHVSGGGFVFNEQDAHSKTLASGRERCADHSGHRMNTP